MNFNSQSIRGSVKVWRDLLSFSRSRLVRSSLLWVTVVPILAKATQSMDNVFSIAIGQKVHVFVLSLPFSWILFYFGALAFLMGNLIVGWRCPRILKETKNYRDYQEQGRAITELIRYVDLLTPVGFRTQVKIDKIKQELQTIDRAVSENIFRPSSHDMPLMEHSIASAYQFAVYDGADWFHLWSRFSAQAAYLVGAIFYLLVVAQSSKYVIESFVQT